MFPTWNSLVDSVITERNLYSNTNDHKLVFHTTHYTQKVWLACDLCSADYWFKCWQGYGLPKILVVFLSPST
jgi:hypothetical protein